MNIREFRGVIGSAFKEQDFVEKRVPKGTLKYWTLPAGEIVPFFVPHAQRRSWGFVLAGYIGIEIPALREWLNIYKPAEQSGIFHSMFVGYHTANEDVLNGFMLEHGAPVPADLWAGLIKDRLLLIPSSVDALLATYRSRREELGWLAHPHQKPAWDFLLRWRENPAPELLVPRMLRDGRIA